MKDDLLGLGGMNTPSVDPRNYETIKCDKCGGILFTSQYVLKKISGLEVGNGTKSTFFPLSVLVCSKCGQIWSEDVRGYKLEDDIKSNNDNSQLESNSLHIENNTGNLIIN